MALAEVLEQQGVRVLPTSTLDATADAVDYPAATTIVVYDSTGLLSDTQVKRLLGLASHLVVLNPTTGVLDIVAPGVLAAGTPDDDDLVAACDLLPATNAGTVSSSGTTYRISETAPTATGCLLSSSNDAPDAYSWVQLATEGTVVSVVGVTDALTNAEISSEGNAAFALGLLGDHPTLVWYLPSVADTGGVVASDFTPPALTPVIVLLALTAIGAAFWRGRRFGPLIIENLPVIVRASETMEGRARLYENSSARSRALDALRIGTIGRLATACGLSTTASVADVAASVAALSERDLTDIRSLLIDAVPASDRDLMRLSDELLRLESAIAAALRPA
jgi:hypothetical protein